MGHSETLSVKQMQAISALLECPSVSDAAERVGCNRKTLTRWLREPAFVAALNAAKLDLVRHSTRRLAGALSASVTTVVRLAVLSEDEPTRLRAALAVPTMLRELSEHGDLEERISRLEAQRNGH